MNLDILQKRGLLGKSNGDMMNERMRKEYTRIQAMTPEEMEKETSRLVEDLRRFGILVDDKAPTYPNCIEAQEAKKIKKHCVDIGRKCKRCPYESNIQPRRCIFKDKPATWRF